MKISNPLHFDFNRIKTIIFDWGGVITNLLPQAAIDAFTQLGHPDFGSYLLALDDDLFLRHETGKATDEDIYERLRTEIGKPLSTEEIDRAFCSMLLDTPPLRLEILEELRQQYKLLLLSNTNSIHTTFYNKNLRELTGRDFYSYFDKIYYSHQIGLRKPHREIFEYVLHDYGIKPEETLFIDDTEININTARSLNINCLHINHELSIEKIFLSE
jgi:glucose-1-phosphatase